MAKNTNILNDKNAIDTLTLIYVTNKETAKTIMSALQLDFRQVDTTLQKLRRNKLIAFNRETRTWEITDHGKVFHDFVVTSVQREEYIESVLKVSETVNDGDLESQHQLAASAAQEESEKNMSDNTQTLESSTNINDIDAAIAAARSAKGQAPPGQKRAKLSDEEKAQRAQAELDAKEERASARAKIKAEKEASKSNKVAHMSKVDKAASRLPQLSTQASEAFSELTLNLTSTDITTLIAHLSHFNRTQATQRALTVAVKVGDRVKINGGEARYIGLEGTVAKSQRIRCYVDVVVGDSTKQVYLFTSDVSPVEIAAEEQVAANG